MILFALPGSLIILITLNIVVKTLRLMPAELSFNWLIVPTIGLGAGAIIICFVADNLVFWPSQLQNELAGRQFVGPLSLRSHSDWGFQDEVRTWVYDVDPARAAQLASRCRPNPDPRRHWCGIVSLHEEGPERGDGRDVFIHMEGTTVTLEEWLY